MGTNVSIGEAQDIATVHGWRKDTSVIAEGNTVRTIYRKGDSRAVVYHTNGTVEAVYTGNGEDVTESVEDYLTA